MTAASQVWVALMFTTGFCSMIYELALAQLLSGLLGNALARFATTLGFYVFGMGLGSVLFVSRSPESDASLFFKAELALALTGLASPLIFVLAYKLSFLSADPSIQNWIVVLITHAVIFLTGLLSGFELPVLSSLLQRTSANSEGRILAADYAGMFLASLCFPLFLYPVLGLIPALFTATTLNIIAAALTYWVVGGRTKLMQILLAMILVANVATLVYAGPFQDWLSGIYASVR